MAESKSIKNTKKAPRTPVKDKEARGLEALPWWQRLVPFLQEVKGELRKVVWPPRKQVMVSTGVVLILVIIAASFLGLVDWALSGLVRLVLGIRG